MRINGAVVWSGHTNNSWNRETNFCRKRQVSVMFQFLSLDVFFKFQIKVRSINRLMDLLDIGMNYYNYSLCVRFNTAWNMWCLMSVSDLSSKCVATPFFAATFSAAFGSVWPRVINRQAHTKTTKTAWTVPIRKIGLNRYQYQHKSFHIQQNKLLRVDFWTISKGHTTKYQSIVVVLALSIFLLTVYITPLDP